LFRSLPGPKRAPGEELSRLLAATEEPDDTAAPPIARASQRLRLFDAVASTLADAAHHTPLLLVFDDLQPADPGSLRMLDQWRRPLRLRGRSPTSPRSCSGARS
jgi:predicted ATPase